jgi:endonuclease III
MRTSKLSRDTAKAVQTLSASGRPRRQTRNLVSSIRSATFTDGAVDLNRTSTVSLEDEDNGSSSSTPGSVFGEDIEDALLPPSKKRRRGSDRPYVVTTTKTSVGSTRTIPRKPIIKAEYSDISPSKSDIARRLPARKITEPDGSVTIHPPSNWQKIYDTIHEMRKRNPTAPVDTMGCEDLYHASSSPRDRRFQTLIALMMSSQTKDTVTAAAMQKLHTQLFPSTTKLPSSQEESSLTLENILAVPSARLNELITAVGFHNNKTKYIKAAALILRDEYNGDIPNTPQGLMRLPGVGPKMAYLCMSAAWGIDLGIGVDVHVHRITNLWAWHKTKNPEETRMWLEGWLPKEKWHEINKMLVGLGQTVCLPVGRRCDECDLGGTGLCAGEVRVGKVKRQKIKDVVVGKRETSDVLQDVVIKEEVVANLGDIETSAIDRDIKKASPD